MRVLAYSGNIAVIDEIKEKLTGKDVMTTRQKDKFLEFAYSKDYDIVCVDIWDADKEASGTANQRKRRRTNPAHIHRRARQHETEIGRAHV